MAKTRVKTRVRTRKVVAKRTIPRRSRGKGRARNRIERGKLHNRTMPEKRGTNFRQLMCDYIGDGTSTSAVNDDAARPEVVSQLPPEDDEMRGRQYPGYFGALKLKSRGEFCMKSKENEKTGLKNTDSIFDDDKLTSYKTVKAASEKLTIHHEPEKLSMEDISRRRDERGKEHEGTREVKSHTYGLADSLDNSKLVKEHALLSEDLGTKVNREPNGVPDDNMFDDECDREVNEIISSGKTKPCSKSVMKEVQIVEKKKVFNKGDAFYEPAGDKMGFDTEMSAMCLNCTKAQLEADLFKRKLTDNFLILKQRIVSTSEIVKAYRQKCQDFDKQKREKADLEAKLDLCYEETAGLRQQLKKTTEVREYLQKGFRRLEREKLFAYAQIDQIKTKLSETEFRCAELKEMAGCGTVPTDSPSLLSELKEVTKTASQLRRKNSTLESNLLKLKEKLKEQKASCRKQVKLAKSGANTEDVSRLKKKLDNAQAAVYRLRRELKNVKKLKSKNTSGTRRRCTRKKIASSQRPTSSASGSSSSSSASESDTDSDAKTDSEISDEPGGGIQEMEQTTFPFLQEFRVTAPLSPLPLSPPKPRTTATGSYSCTGEKERIEVHRVEEHGESICEESDRGTWPTLSPNNDKKDSKTYRRDSLVVVESLPCSDNDTKQSLVNNFADTDNVGSPNNTTDENSVVNNVPKVDLWKIKSKDFSEIPMSLDARARVDEDKKQQSQKLTDSSLENCLYEHLFGGSVSDSDASVGNEDDSSSYCSSKSDLYYFYCSSDYNITDSDKEEEDTDAVDITDSSSCPKEFEEDSSKQAKVNSDYTLRSGDNSTSTLINVLGVYLLEKSKIGVITDNTQDNYVHQCKSVKLKCQDVIKPLYIRKIALEYNLSCDVNTNDTDCDAKHDQEEHSTRVLSENEDVGNFLTHLPLPSNSPPKRCRFIQHYANVLLDSSDRILGHARHFDTAPKRASRPRNNSESGQVLQTGSFFKLRKCKSDSSVYQKINARRLDNIRTSPLVPVQSSSANSAPQNLNPVLMTGQRNTVSVDSCVKQNTPFNGNSVGCGLDTSTGKLGQTTLQPNFRTRSSSNIHVNDQLSVTSCPLYRPAVASGESHTAVDALGCDNREAPTRTMSPLRLLSTTTVVSPLPSTPTYVPGAVSPIPTTPVRIITTGDVHFTTTISPFPPTPVRTISVLSPLPCSPLPIVHSVSPLISTPPPESTLSPLPQSPVCDADNTNGTQTSATNVPRSSQLKTSPPLLDEIAHRLKCNEIHKPVAVSRKSARILNFDEGDQDNGTSTFASQNSRRDTRTSSLSVFLHQHSKSSVSSAFSKAQKLQTSPTHTADANERHQHCGNGKSQLSSTNNNSNENAAQNTSENTSEKISKDSDITDATSCEILRPEGRLSGINREQCHLTEMSGLDEVHLLNRSSCVPDDPFCLSDKNKSGSEHRSDKCPSNPAYDMNNDFARPLTKSKECSKRRCSGTDKKCSDTVKRIKPWVSSQAKSKEPASEQSLEDYMIERDCGVLDNISSVSAKGKKCSNTAKNSKPSKSSQAKCGESASEHRVKRCILDLDDYVSDDPCSDTKCSDRVVSVKSFGNSVAKTGMSCKLEQRLNRSILGSEDVGDEDDANDFSCPVTKSRRKSRAKTERPLLKQKSERTFSDHDESSNNDKSVCLSNRKNKNSNNIESDKTINQMQSFDKGKDFSLNCDEKDMVEHQKTAYAKVRGRQGHSCNVSAQRKQRNVISNAQQSENVESTTSKSYRDRKAMLVSKIIAKRSTGLSFNNGSSATNNTSYEDRFQEGVDRDEHDGVVGKKRRCCSPSKQKGTCNSDNIVLQERKSQEETERPLSIHKLKQGVRQRTGQNQSNTRKSATVRLLEDSQTHEDTNSTRSLALDLPSLPIKGKGAALHIDADTKVPNNERVKFKEHELDISNVQKSKVKGYPTGSKRPLSNPGKTGNEESRIKTESRLNEHHTATKMSLRYRKTNEPDVAALKQQCKIKPSIDLSVSIDDVCTYAISRVKVNIGFLEPKIPLPTRSQFMDESRYASLCFEKLANKACAPEDVVERLRVEKCITIPHIVIAAMISTLISTDEINVTLSYSRLEDRIPILDNGKCELCDQVLASKFGFVRSWGFLATKKLNVKDRLLENRLSKFDDDSQGPIRVPLLTSFEKALLVTIELLSSEHRFQEIPAGLLHLLPKIIFKRRELLSCRKASLCRMLTALCYRKGELNRIRTLIYDLFHSSNEHASVPGLLLSILLVCPDIIKLYDCPYCVELKKSPVSFTIKLFSLKFSADFGLLCLGTLEKIFQMKAPDNAAIQRCIRQMATFLSRGGSDQSSEVALRNFELIKAVELLALQMTLDWVLRNITGITSTLRKAFFETNAEEHTKTLSQVDGRKCCTNLSLLAVFCRVAVMKKHDDFADSIEVCTFFLDGCNEAWRPIEIEAINVLLELSPKISLVTVQVLDKAAARIDGFPPHLLHKVQSLRKWSGSN